MRAYIETYGCAFNKADSESMAWLLEKAGFSLVPEKDADLIIVNTCTVKTKTEQKTLERIKALSKAGKKLLVAGCMAQTQPSLILKAAPDASLLGTFARSEVARVAKEMIAGAQVKELDRYPSHFIPSSRSNPFIGTFQIAQGCLGSCTYCAARLARGELKSFPISDILSSIRSSLAEGCKEVRLTAQDCGVFGEDSGESLGVLLDSILSLPGDFRVRLGMMNPTGALKNMDALLSAFKDPKMYLFAHIPVQSGSDTVLASMNRRYKAADFENACSALKAAFPELTLATDIIVGFPSESEKDFEASMALMERVRPDIINISRFTPRPNTPAALMKPLKSEVLKSRSSRMSLLCSRLSLANAKGFVGKRDRILVLETSKNGLLGRSSNFRSVALKEGSIGSFVEATFEKAYSKYLLAKATEKLY